MRNLLLSLTLFLSTLAFGQRIKVIEVNDLEQYEEVLGISKNTDQLLFIILNKQGAGLNQMIEEDVFDTPALQAEMHKTIPVMVQLSSDMGSRLAQSFSPEAFPAIYILNKEETVLGRSQGYATSPALLSMLSQAQKHDTLYPKLTEAYVQKSLSAAQWRQLLDIYTLNHSFIETQELALEYFATLNDIEQLKKENVAYLLNYGISLEERYPEFLWKNKKQVNERYPGFNEDAFFESVYGFNLNLAVLSEDSILLEKILTEWVSKAPKGEVQLLRLETQKYFAEETKQFERYPLAVENFIAQSDSNITDTAEFLYSEAFYLADTYATASARKAARKLAIQAFALNPDFRYKMLAGYMSYLLKEYTLAAKQVNEALELSELPANTRKANSLLEMIEEEMEKEPAKGPIQYSR